MVLTINSLFNDSAIVQAVIDRVVANGLDEIFWKRHLDFEQTQSRVFKTYMGTQLGVKAGSIIDRNSNKPIRERGNLGYGIGEVAYLGDRYQMDNDRLDMLQTLIDVYNASKPADQVNAMNEIIAYLTDDLRQVLLAPHKRMDLVVGELRSKGSASVTSNNNPNGVEVLSMQLPVHNLTPASTVKNTFISYLKEQIEDLRLKYGNFSLIEMNRKTFNETIIGSTEFGTTYQALFASSRVNLATGLITGEMASEVFVGIGLPRIVINEDLVQTDDGMKKVFADNRIALFPDVKIGKMKWHTPYEATDPIPNKVYARSEGGMYISNQRTDEGRFMEYGCEWIPDIANPNRIVIINTETMTAG